MKCDSRHSQDVGWVKTRGLVVVFGLCPPHPPTPPRRRPNVAVTLQGVSQQRVQLWVELGLLLQHVEEQLVLRGAGDLCLLQTALHHLHLGLPLGGLETLETEEGLTKHRVGCALKIRSLFDFWSYQNIQVINSIMLYQIMAVI